MTSSSEEKTQRVYARIAGLLFLLVFATAFAGFFIIPEGIIVSGDFAATSQNMKSSEQTYRLALSSRLASSLLTIGLAAALFALLAPVDRTLALVAMLSRTAEFAIGGVTVVFGFAILSVYTGAASVFSAGEQEAVAKLLWDFDDAFFAAAIIFFSLGSTIFFFLLFRSRFIPRLFTFFGAFGSPLITLYGFALLMDVELPSNIDYFVWTPGAIAELGGGLWLLVMGANLKYWRRKTNVATDDHEERI